MASNVENFTLDSYIKTEKKKRASNRGVQRTVWDHFDLFLTEPHPHSRESEELLAETAAKTTGAIGSAREEAED